MSLYFAFPHSNWLRTSDFGLRVSTNDRTGQSGGVRVPKPEARSLKPVPTGSEARFGSNPLDVVVALVFRDGRLFLQRRDPHAKVMPGLWELPGGKIEPGENPDEALYRELQEELRWTPEEAIPHDPLSFDYPDRSVRLHPFRCSGPGRLHSLLAWGWFRPAEIQKLAVPDATRALLNR